MECVNEQRTISQIYFQTSVIKKQDKCRINKLKETQVYLIICKKETCQSVHTQITTQLIIHACYRLQNCKKLADEKLISMLKLT